MINYLEKNLLHDIKFSMNLFKSFPTRIFIPEKLVALSYVKKCREIYHINLIIRKKVSVLGQSCEEEVLVWVFPNHESKTSDLEKPILALPIHRIDIPEKLKKWHQEVETVASGGLKSGIMRMKKWHQEVD